MTHEKILTRDDGTRVRISVTMSVRVYVSGYEFFWSVICHKCQKGKRKFIGLMKESQDYRLNRQEREREYRRRVLEVVTKDEIEQVMRELVEKIPMEY